MRTSLTFSHIRTENSAEKEHLMCIMDGIIPPNIQNVVISTLSSEKFYNTETQRKKENGTIRN